jgi:NACalpha-BTF3-like transcription factor
MNTNTVKLARLPDGLEVSIANCVGVAKIIGRNKPNNYQVQRADGSVVDVMRQQLFIERNGRWIPASRYAKQQQQQQDSAALGAALFLAAHGVRVKR